MKTKKKTQPVNYAVIRQNLLKRDGALDGRFRTQKILDGRREASRKACRTKVDAI